MRVMNVLVILLAGVLAVGCSSTSEPEGDRPAQTGGDERDASQTAPRSALPSQPTSAGGYTFTRPPLVVVERVRGNNGFSVWFRLSKALRTHCSRVCRIDDLAPRNPGRITLSGGGTDSDPAGILRSPSQKGRYCYEQDVSDYARDSPLADAVPGNPVTVRLEIPTSTDL